MFQATCDTIPTLQPWPQTCNMAELAGSVVGVIFLGIQVCQGLTTNLEKIKECAGMQVSGGPRRHLNVLRSTTKDNGVATQARLGVQNRTSACVSGIIELNHELSKTQEVRSLALDPSYTTRGAAYLYPFREDTHKWYCQGKTWQSKPGSRCATSVRLFDEVNPIIFLVLTRLLGKVSQDPKEELKHVSTQVDELTAFYPNLLAIIYVLRAQPGSRE